MSDYEYLGYLETILPAPDPAARDNADAIVYTAEDLATWSLEDLEYTVEWRNIPARKLQTETGIQLEGHFDRVASIDSLSSDDPRHWVPLTSVDLTGGQFPVDTTRYPIIEVTYRCTSEHAHPVWMWTYDGGSHFGALPKTTEWKTVAKNLQHFGFPKCIDNLIFRLYSSSRTTESFEIQSVRFRAMTEIEQEALDTNQIILKESVQADTFPVLDDFLPLGVYMDADTSKRLASSLGISTDEYWDFVMEDLVTHDHNSIALSHVDELSADEWSSLLQKCDENGIKLLARHEFPIHGTKKEMKEAIQKSIKPYANSDAIFCRGFSGEPAEEDFQKILQAKTMIEAADPNHPVSLIARYPNAYGLFAPYFQASGVGHFQTKRPWDAGHMVRSHVPLGNAQQFWVAAPAFMYPTQTPEWSSSPEMRLMLNLSFANGARGWFSYSYHNDPLWVQGRVQRTLTGPFLGFSDLWEELGHRMRYAHTLAPLLLNATIEESMDDWFVDGVSTDTESVPAPGVPPISHFHLRGDDYSLYFTINNNIRDMASVDIDIPKDAAPGMEMYDVSEFIASQSWKPMQRTRHDEMFPGKETVILVASPERCAQWHDVMAQRIIQIDRAKLKYSLDLARAYQLPFSPIENTLEGIGDGSHPETIGIVHQARGDLIDLLQREPNYAQLNTTLYHIRSAMCGCDGALCRLMQMGKNDLARSIGSELLPMAAESTQMRLELKRGNAAAHLESAENLKQLALATLDRIRAHYS